VSAEDSAGLRSKVFAGFAWSLGVNVLVQLSRIAFAVALARFLTPHEYGLAGMALVFSALVLAFSDLSLGVALVQRREITEQDRSTVFWTSAAVGVSLTLAGLALSGPLASFYGESDVQPLFAALSVSFVITSLGATHAALLHREMKYKAINVRVAASTLLGGAAGVAFAAAGYGAWSLIVGQLVIAAVSTGLLWFSLPWRPRLTFSLHSLRDLGTFGIRIFGVRVLEYARNNGDKLLVGRLLGAAPLGVYTVAFNIHLLPISRFLVIVQDTLLPALSRLQDERERLAAAWLRATRLVAAVMIPTLLGLVVVAPDLVTVLLGERWSEAAPLLQIMAAGLIAVAVSAIGFEVLMALGRGTTLLRFSVTEVAALMAAMALGVQWGLSGVALAYALVHVPTRTYLAWLTARTVGVPFSRFLGSLTDVGQAALVMLAVVASTRFALVEAEVAAWLRLIIVVIAGVAVYTPVCLWRVPELRAELQGLRRRVTRAPREAAVAH
jgi:O-antigen/teichoic acid export membrane protein